MRNQISFLLSLTLLLLGCSHESNDSCKLVIQVAAASGEKIYLSKIPYIDEKSFPADSAICQGPKGSILFHMKRENDRVYELFIRSSGKKFYFIPDAPAIHIRANNFTGEYSIEGSPASSSLLNLTNRRKANLYAAQKIKRMADSLGRSGQADPGKIESLKKQFLDIQARVEQDSRLYADTVSNPAAFLFSYNLIDFGDDRHALRQFIQHAARRFPHTAPVQKLVQEVMDMISIYEMEFNIGDSLPSISLPDRNGYLFSTSTLKGKYYLIDFWATWCPTCAAYEPYKRELSKQFPREKFQLVSVALDDNPSSWAKAIQQSGHNWTDLVDEKMWRGIAAKTLKFDSIPFNFLVSPQGIVLAKAIRPDSLEFIIRKTVK